MVNVIRRFQQPLLIALTVVVIIAFVILYGGPGARLDGLSKESVGKLYSRDVSPLEYRNAAKQFDVCRMLGMFDVIIPMAQNSRTMQDAVDHYAWNTLILRKEAAALGIHPTENEIAEAIRRLPAFQKDGHYDHSRYEMAMQTALLPRGISPTQFEEIIRDSLRLQAIRDAIAASSTPSKDELTTAYRRQYQKVEASAVRFSREEVSKSITVSEDDLKQTFEARKENLKTSEKRKVDVAFIAMPKVEKDGPRPEPEAIQKLADKASDLAAAVQEPGANFEEAAKRFELEVKTTAAFEAGDRLEELGNEPRISLAAFKLTQEKPFSEALGSSKGYFILRLKEVEEAKPLTFEEAKARLQESILKDRTRETLTLKASEARKKLEESLKAGKSFADAATEAALKAEAFEAFSRSESKITGADATLIQNSALDLEEGKISSPLESADGMVLVYLSKRLPIDPEDVEKQKAVLSPMLETQRTDGLLGEWIERRRLSAGLTQSANSESRPTAP
ncbi:MAG: hypothetical protein RLZZ399_524 [Verrucomicrobiota bacterium]|jgi:hypothetical protein